MQVVFPAAHVCQRLEQAAAGMWPEAGPMATDEDVVQDTLLQVSNALCRAVENETAVSDGGSGRSKKLGEFLVAHVFWQSSCSKLLCRASR